MKIKISILIAICSLYIVSGSVVRAQQTPDTILYNGKIITMDNHEVNENIGTIVQALAIKDGHIVTVGSTSQIKALGGPKTTMIDLKGRTVSPGFGATHDHPMDFDQVNPYIVKKVVSDDVHIERFISAPPDQILNQFMKVMQESVQKAKPGQWIRISILYGDDYQWGPGVESLLGHQINKQLLDTLAPNNPVTLRSGFATVMVNSRGMEEVRKSYENERVKFDYDPGKEVSAEGKGGTFFLRYLDQNVVYRQQELREIYRQGLSWMGGYGVTLTSSGLYTPGAVEAYRTLDQNKQMAIRLAYSWQWRPRPDLWSDPYFPQIMTTMLGQGSDHLWLVGLWPSENGANCTTLPGTSPEVKQREGECHFLPGGQQETALYYMVKAGGRLAGIHTGADSDIDNIISIIERASKDAGMTPDQIRAKRHAYDHLAMSPRPDQVPKLKNLGMIVGGWNLYIWEGGAAQVMKDYGEQGVQWVVPRKSIFQGGVRETVEIDRPIGYTNLTYMNVLATGIIRKGRDGIVYAPQQTISREVMLKSATIHAAYYALREDQLGSLEPGKLADLVVFDHDYLTVPVDDIGKLRVMMTMVGGKIIHLVPSLAREWGMQPTGAQVELGGHAAQW